jgi:hypothetical protein
VTTFLMLVRRASIGTFDVPRRITSSYRNVLNLGCEELRHNQCSFLKRIYKPRQIDIIAPTTIAYP